MKQKRSILFVVWFAIFAIGGETWAQSVPRNILQDVVTEKDEERMNIRFQFKHSVTRFDPPVFLGKSVQLDLHDARIRPSKRFFYTGDDRIPQIVVTQINSKTLRVQFVLGQNLPGLSENFKLEKRGKTLTVRLADPEEEILDRLLAQAAKKLDAQSASRSAPIKKRNPKTSTQSPVGSVVRASKYVESESSVQSPKAGAVKPAKQEILYKDAAKIETNVALDPIPTTVRMLTMLCLVIGFMFLIFYVFKKFVLKNTLFGGNEKLVRVLGTGFLAPKKNIALVEVAGEVLVLGISNDQISLLSKIRDEERIEKIRSFGEKRNKKASAKEKKIEKESQKSKRAQPDAMPASGFTKYLEQFSDVRSNKEKSVDAVTQKIRQNLGKLKSL